MTNGADPDQLASLEPTDLDLHCLLRQGMSCSAREGLILFETGQTSNLYQYNVTGDSVTSVNPGCDTAVRWHYKKCICSHCHIQALSQHD